MASITAELTEGTVVAIGNGRHTWRADEPIDVNGTDTGPNPYELLLGSLAACTCITLALYCRHKNIALHRVQATYEFSRIHAEDCADCDNAEGGRVDFVQSHLIIEGDLDEQQRRRLTQVAERCPVHKTLVRGMHIEDDVQFT